MIQEPLSQALDRGVLPHRHWLVFWGEALLSMLAFEVQGSKAGVLDKVNVGSALI